MSKQYMVPINSPEVDEDGNVGSVTADVVTLTGTKKKRRKQWREYLRVRLGSNDVHLMNKVTRALGFEELL